MFVMRPPRPPLLGPHRSMFNTEQEYERAMESHRKQVAERREEGKNELAVVLVTGAVMALMVLGLIAALSFLMAGWKGIVGAVLTPLLFWAAVSRVRMYL
jgi:uncharacterized membrane-anchored protein